MNTRSPLLMKLAALLLATLASLAMLEASLQFLYRARNGAWLPVHDTAFHVAYTQAVDDRRQYALRPNYRNDRTGLTVDEHGFRRSARQKSDSNKVIVALGDSVPFGAGVSDEDTYPAILGELLRNATYGSRVDVLNAGVPSYNLRQSYDRLRFDVLKHVHVTQMAAVTVQAANDISLLTHFRDRWTPDVTWADARWSHTWIRPTVFATAHYIAQARTTAKRSVEQHEKYPGNRMLMGIATTLKEFDDFARENRVPVILMPVDPFYYQTRNTAQNPMLPLWSRNQDYIEKWGDLVAQFNRELETAAHTSDSLFFFDTRAILDGTDRNLCYIDFLHLSPYGNRLLATALLSYLKTTALLPSE